MISEILALSFIILFILSSGSIGLYYLIGTRYIKENESSLLFEAKTILARSALSMKYKEYLPALEKVTLSPMADLMRGGFINIDKPYIVNVNPLAKSRNDLIHIIVHELVHVLQVHYYGRDNGSNLYEYFRSKYGYDYVPLEVEANNINNLVKLNAAQEMINDYIDKVESNHSLENNILRWNKDS